MEDTDIQIRSDEVQELMNFIPSRIVQWGITVIFLTLLVALYVAWRIEYPDVINARVKIVSVPPPIDLIARVDGKLTLFVQDMSIVTSGTRLAIIENPADLKDVFALKKSLESFQSSIKTPAGITNVVFDRTASLGTLQSTYNEFIKNLLSYQLILKHTADPSAQSVAPRYGDHVSKLVHDRAILNEELDIARRKFESNKILFDKGRISALSLAEYKETYNKKKTSLNYIDAEIEYATDNLVLTIELMYKRLESQLAQWEHTYVFYAPINGTVSLFEFWNNNQFVDSGDTVLTIIPKSSTIIGKVLMPVAGSGKVEQGQKVLIKCDSYPYREYGFVTGYVDTMSLIAHNNQYIVKVQLPNGLTTTSNKELGFKQEMDGSAMIITKEARLITRIFNQFRHIFASSSF